MDDALNENTIQGEAGDRSDLAGLQLAAALRQIHSFF
jgi:hypothetical protein